MEGEGSGDQGEGEEEMTYRVYLTTKVNPAKLAEGSGIIVIEPDDYTTAQIKAIKAKGYKVLAYLSVGSIEKDRSWYKTYKKYGLRTLEDWPDEVYADVRRTNWRQFLIKRAKELKKKGFQGFWCDNLDVYEYYKSEKMFAACKAVLKQIKSLGYTMVNGGSVWINDAIGKGVKLSDYISGYTQEEVFSRITDYSGKGKFSKQKASDRTYYQTMIKKVIKAKVEGFLLEYTRDATLKAKIKNWCKKYGASCCISGDVNL